MPSLLFSLSLGRKGRGKILSLCALPNPVCRAPLLPFSRWLLLSLRSLHWEGVRRGRASVDGKLLGSRNALVCLGSLGSNTLGCQAPLPNTAHLFDGLFMAFGKPTNLASRFCCKQVSRASKGWSGRALTASLALRRPQNVTSHFCQSPEVKTGQHFAVLAPRQPRSQDHNCKNGVRSRYGTHFRAKRKLRWIVLFSTSTHRF